MENKRTKKKDVKENKLKYWHTLDAEQVLTNVNSCVDGLSSMEAEKRLAEFGKNTLPQKKGKSIFKVILNELLNPIILLLIVASIFSFLTKEYIDAGVVIAIILIDVIIGASQEKKAERVAKSLLNLIKVKTKVLRDGEKTLIDAENLVIGDIVYLESGDNVSADLRILSCTNLKVDEAVLTGESLNSEKNVEIVNQDVMLGDRKNMLFAGSSVITGRAMAVVVEIGASTEIGTIATKIIEVKKESAPLFKRIKTFSKQITIIIAIVAVILFVVLKVQGNPVQEIFLAVVALAVSAIPEGLPLAVTMVLTLGSNRMGKKNVVVKNLNAVESLGSCTIIASDKTGTLTLNEQTAKIIVFPNNEEFAVQGSGYNNEGSIIALKNNDIKLVEEIALLGAVNNEASLTKKENEFKHFGDSIDVAFLSLAMKANVSKKNFKIIKQIPYESEKKYSAVFYKKEETIFCTAKGSLEKILSICTHMQVSNEIVKIDKNFLQKQHQELAKKGFRVIALAKKENIEQDKCEENLIENMVFVEMVGFIDPIRKESKTAVDNCHNAGIKVVMITGDHPLTAFAIAKEIDIASDFSHITTGDEIQKYFEMGTKEFDKFVKSKTVFSRVTPTDKLNIVESFKRMGEFVAVTGDGVNDAPAIKSAHIGIAMGSGTDVAKETADMIITDDNFNSIVQGIKEGRNAYSNVRKVTYLLLSTGFAEILFFLMSVIFNMPLPLLALQLLWLNIITNGLQDFALSFEKAENSIMKEGPRPTKESLFSKSLLLETFVAGFTMGIIIFAIWFYLIKLKNVNLIYARNIIMTLMVFLENFQCVNCRSETQSLFKIPVLSNPIYIGSIIGATILQIIIMEIQKLSTLLNLTNISYIHMLILFVISISIILVMELYKLLVRAYRKKKKITGAY